MTMKALTKTSFWSGSPIINLITWTLLQKKTMTLKMLLTPNTMTLTKFEAHYKAPGDPWVKYVKTQWLTLGEWGCPLDNGLELVVGQPNSSWKKNWNFNISWQTQIFSLIPCHINAWSLNKNFDDLDHVLNLSCTYCILILIFIKLTS